MVSKTDKLLRSLNKRIPVQTAIATDIFIPNYSGIQDHIKKTATDNHKEMYVADNSTAQSIPTGATYTAVTNADLTLAKKGVYLINTSYTGRSGTANVIFDGALFLNGTIQDNFKCSTDFSGADRDCGHALTGLITITTVNSVVGFRVKHDNVGSINLTIKHANLNAIYIGLV